MRASRHAGLSASGNARPQAAHSRAASAERLAAGRAGGQLRARRDLVARRLGQGLAHVLRAQPRRLLGLRGQHVEAEGRRDAGAALAAEPDRLVRRIRVDAAGEARRPGAARRSRAARADPRARCTPARARAAARAAAPPGGWLRRRSGARRRSRGIGVTHCWNSPPQLGQTLNMGRRSMALPRRPRRLAPSEFRPPETGPCAGA